MTPYSGAVNTAQPGVYTLLYRHIDSASNTGNTVTRTITVSDIVAPVVTVLGSGSVVQELDLPYVDAGANWTDDVDGSGSVVASGTSLMTSTGVYTLTYTKTDTSGNIGTGSREVTIVDTIPPTVNITTQPATVDATAFLVS